MFTFTMAQHQTEEARKIQILEAATHCVGRFGYHQTSVDTIAREAGLSKGAIYWYFKSKDDILIALSEWRGANNLFFLQRLADETDFLRITRRPPASAAPHCSGKVY